VSKNFIDLGKRLNKAIPHLNHIHFQGVNLKYKIIGDLIIKKVKKYEKR